MTSKSSLENLQEWMFTLPIAFLFPFFCSKGVDVFYGKKALDDERWGCSKKFPSSSHSDYLDFREKGKNPSYDACIETAEEALDRFKLHRYIILLAIGVATVVLSHFIKTPSTQIGLSIGGVITILYATASYWEKMGERLKFTATGIGLGVLVFYSYKFFKNPSS